MHWTSRLRRWHRAATLVIGAQLVVWTTTGFAFSWFDFEAVRGAADRAPPPPLDATRVRVTLADAVERARAAAHAPAAAPTAVALRMLRGAPVYLVSLAALAAPVVVDAGDGQVRAPLDAAAAAEVARAAFVRPPPAPAVELVTRAGVVPDLMPPFYRVRFADAAATEVFVAPASGEVLAWRNRSWRWFDRLWSLHVLGYVSRDNPAHLPMRVAGGLGLFVALTGVGLYLGTAWRRERRS